MTKRKPITISASTDGELTDYQVQIDVTYDADMQADFSDVRFRGNDARSNLDFWLQEYTASTSATFWVKIPVIPATTGTIIFMYYNDTSAPGGSDIEATMLDGDDFSRASLNNAGTWTKSSNNVLNAGNYADPDVWYENGVFYVLVDDQDNGTIRMLSSADFESTSWTDEGEVITKGTSGAWDDFDVRDPSIVKVGSTYYLFYTGSDGAVGGQDIGVATATTITGPYTKYGSNPVLSKPGGLNEFDVTYDGNTFVASYTDGNAATTTEQGTGQIGRATSSDGLSWTDQGIIQTDNYGIEWQDQTTFLEKGDYIMHMNSDATGDTYVAMSKNNSTWGFPTTGGGIPLGAGGSYDDATVFAPSMVKVGDTWYAYYQANDGANQRLAVATTTDISPDKWYQSHDSFTIVSNQLKKTGGAASWALSTTRYFFDPPYTAEFHINQIAADSANFISGIYFGEDTSSNHYGLQFDMTGTDRIATWRTNLPTPGSVNTNPSTDSTQTLSLSTDYQFRVFVTATGYTVDFYDGSWHTGILSETRDMQAGGAGFFTFGTGTYDQFVSDWLFIRKYAADEPTPSVGSEETVDDLPFLIAS